MTDASWFTRERREVWLRTVTVKVWTSLVKLIGKKMPNPVRSSPDLLGHKRRSRSFRTGTAQVPYGFGVAGAARRPGE